MTAARCCRGEVPVRSLPIFYTAAPPFMVMPSYVNVCARYEHPCDVQAFRLPSRPLVPPDAVGVRSR